MAKKTTDKDSAWQRLMTHAYDGWQNHEDWSYERFVFSLTGPERLAVLLGNLRYQPEIQAFLTPLAEGV